MTKQTLLNSVKEAKQALIGPTVVSIGNYDGVHLGHQHVVTQLLEKSRLFGLPSVVVTFDPLAKEYFAQKTGGYKTPTRLSLKRHRAELLLAQGVDYVCFVYRLTRSWQTSWLKILSPNY